MRLNVMAGHIDLKHIIPAFIFFAAIFCLNTTPINDGDLFWHVKTGQWIWEHKALPQSDPFSYTVSDKNPFRPESHRIQFILQQYWLGQLGLYGIWKVAGEAGIVLFRAFAYTGILAFLYWWMRRLSNGILPLVLVFLTGKHLLHFPSERPQLFSFIFFPLLLYLLEKARAPDSPHSSRHAAIIPLLMLIWANTHGSFILGVVIILVYLVTLVSLHLMRRESCSKTILITMAGAVLLSGMNPCGFEAFTEIFGTKQYYSAAIVENMSPVTIFLRLNAFYPAYWAFLAFAVLTLCIHIRAFHPVHVLLLFALGVLSLKSMRYTPFLLLAAPVPLGYVKEGEFRYKYFGATVILVAWLAFCDWKTRFRLVTIDYYPKKAVQFLRFARPAPQLFNNYEWGGYLINYLPEYPVFIDGRTLVEEFSFIYGRAMSTSEWRQVFEKFNVNTVLVPGFNRHDGTKNQLPLDLINSSDWYLVFQDAAAMVFVRNIPENAEVIKNYAIPKSMAYEHFFRLKEMIENN